MGTRVLHHTKSRVEPDSTAALHGAVTSRRDPVRSWETASTDASSPRPSVRNTVSQRDRARDAWPTCSAPRVLSNRRSTSSATDPSLWLWQPPQHRKDKKCKSDPRMH